MSALLKTTKPNYPMSASLIGRLGSSAFWLSTTGGVDVTRGLALLSGIGTWAFPSWDSKTRWNDLSGGLAVARQVQADIIMADAPAVTILIRLATECA
jgi:hypothetical protein